MPEHTTIPSDTPVIRLKDIDITELSSLLNKYQLQLTLIAEDQEIPGSFWGDEEAGLIHNQVYARTDTPVHSVLHESCHYICMDTQRRLQLHTNAGGNADEENAVCYLQVLLADELSFMGRSAMMRDMDSWGYNFRLGSCHAWFEHDTRDEQQWLLNKQLILANNTPSFLLRQ